MYEETKHSYHLSVNSYDFIKIMAIWIVNRTESLHANAARSLTATSIRSPAIALQRILNLNPSRQNVDKQLLSEPTNTSWCFVCFAQLKLINRTAIPCRDTGPADARPGSSSQPLAARRLPVIGSLTALPMTRSRVRIDRCIVSVQGTSVRSDGQQT